MSQVSSQTTRLPNTTCDCDIHGVWNQVVGCDIGNDVCLRDEECTGKYHTIYYVVESIK